MTITIEKRDHTGRSVFQYTGEIIQREPTFVCIRAIFQREIADLGFVAFHRGDLFIEWFYSDRWYNIFQVHEGESDRLRGWYCNITRPALLSDDHVAADDLALDVFVMPDGETILMDEDEFAALNLHPDEQHIALEAAETLRRAVANREAPFDRISIP